MADKLPVPANIEDPIILKRFLTSLVTGISSGSIEVAPSVNALDKLLDDAYATGNTSSTFLSAIAGIEKLRNDIRGLIEKGLETIILQSADDIAIIAEQFGTFYDQALAASWYGLTVKAGGAVAGLEVGSLDPDVTTPGDESSYFRVVADNFIIGRAYEDISQEEKDYLDNNGLPSFGTVYNPDKTPLPAFTTTWDPVASIYKHYFNGIVEFSNIANANYAGAINAGTTTIYGGKITTGSITASQIASNTITGSKIAANTITGSKIAANTISADLIISKSATNFEQYSQSCPNGVWVSQSFYMDHSGYATVIWSGGWNQSGSGGSYEYRVGINSTSVYQGQSGSWYSSGAPGVGVLMNSAYLVQGWHKFYSYMYISTATANHVARTTLLRSYR